MNYRVVAEAIPKANSGRLMLGFSLKPSADWVGAAYVQACDPREAMNKFEEFFSENAMSWSFDDELETVSGIEYFELDHQVIVKRGDMNRFNMGEVVVGWGF